MLAMLSPQEPEAALVEAVEIADEGTSMRGFAVALLSTIASLDEAAGAAAAVAAAIVGRAGAAPPAKNGGAPSRSTGPGFGTTKVGGEDIA